MKSIDDVAHELAAAHRREDPSTQAVYFLRSEDEVRLVEISRSADSGGEILPFRFGPNLDEGVPYPSVLVLLSPEDWDRVLLGDLRLSEGWDVNLREELH